MTDRLPQPRTRFVGRRRCVEEVRSLLAQHRLVTLTGVGGAGKTRLAVQLIVEAGGVVAEEVLWVDLAALDDPDLVAARVCSAVDVHLAPSTSPVDALIHRLRPTRALLTLDNCEHVLDPCADLVGTLLDRCPEVRVLATSRAPLGLPGEMVWPVPPLSVPATGERVGTRPVPALEAESVQLFLDRARAVRPGFELASGTTRKAVERLCRLLDGIPLALELAAAQVRVLAPAQIAERLESGLDVLRQSSTHLPPRHRTMRGALSWSHDLLLEPERVLFRRMAIFGGGATLEACESVCSGAGLAAEEILDRLTGLVDKSLVAVDERGQVARYRLLEPVRQFAAERLVASGELDHVRRLHARHYLEMAQAMAPALKGGSRAVALGQLETEHDNLRRAWDHALALGDDAVVAGLTRALFWFWNFGGHFSEGRSRSEAALNDSSPDSPALPDLLYAAGTLAWMQGDYDVSRARLEACASRSTSVSRDLRPAALRELAGLFMGLGRLEEAVERCQESVHALRQTERSWDLALTLNMLADARAGLGDEDGAREARAEARALFDRAEDPWGASLALFGMAGSAARAGDLETARLHGEEALALQRQGGDDWNAGQVLVLLAEVEDRAENLQRAGELLLQSIHAFSRVGDRTCLTHSLLCLADVERKQNRTLRAVRLAGAASASAEKLEGSYPYSLVSQKQRARALSALREVVGPATFSEEWARGRSMGLYEAVGFALDAPEADAAAVPVDPKAEEADLRIHALGTAAVYRGRRRLRPSDWTYGVPRQLLFYLLLRGPRTREQIGLDFWPEATTEQLRGRLRTAIYHLRRALGGTEWARYRAGRYDFARDRSYWFDVEAFEKALDRAERPDEEPVSAARHLRRAVALYRGDLLEGEEPGPWAAELRDHLRRRYRRALRTLADLELEAGTVDAAVSLCRQAVACDPLDEEAHRSLARALGLQGDRAGALRQLDELTAILARELGAEPSSETRELRAELARPPR